MAGERALPGLGLEGFWTPGSSGWDADMDANLRLLSAVVQLSVLSATTALPGSPSDGDIYIVPSGAGSNPNAVAVRDNGSWVYLTPGEGWRAWVEDSEEFLFWNGMAWVAEPSGGATTFAELSDTPANYTGQGSKLVAVNSGATALEFVTPPTSGIAEAPTDGKTYGRQSSAWVELLTSDAPRFSVALGASELSVSANTWTTVPFENEFLDNRNAVATGVFTAPESGLYLFGASITYRLNTTAPADMSVGFSINDGTPANYQRNNIPGASLVSNISKGNVVCPIFLSAGDTVRVKVHYTTNAAKVAQTNTSFFWGALVMKSTFAIPVTTLTVNAQTGTSYSGVLGDASGLVTMNNASANTLTIPANASVSYPVGTQIAVKQIGAGATRAQAASGVSLNGVAAGGATISAQWGTLVLTKIGTDAWTVDGPHGGVA